MRYTPEELSDYLLDELPPARRAEIEALLRSSAAAREELERQRGLLQALGSLAEEPPPRRFSFLPAEAPQPPLRRLVPRLLAVSAAIGAALAAGVWAASPAFERHASGWTLTLGTPQQPAAGVTAAQLRAILHEELARSETRWRQALLETSASGADRTRAELDALRREIAETHEDSAAAYAFLNARLELLKRQLVEFDLASFEEALP